LVFFFFFFLVFEVVQPTIFYFCCIDRVEWLLNVKQAILLNLLFCYFFEQVINVRDTIVFPIVKHGSVGFGPFYFLFFIFFMKG
jgi:hypothetical protein